MARDPGGTADLTHVGPEGVWMVDVGAKAATARVAVASGFVRLSARARALLERREGPKGDVLTTAQVAGIQAAKRTWEIVPLTHPLPLSHVAVRLTLEDDGVAIEAECRTTAPTGVEMEALTAVSAAALTVYDMMKAVDRAMVIERVRLERKEGGRSGVWTREGAR
jgi:cyclic pyranopterin phosphate synthase